MSKKKALGQGLDALLGGDIDLDMPAENLAGPQGVAMLPISQIKPNPDQPRERFDREALEELSESIRQQGVIQPIIAEERADGTYLIVAGERRWRAGRMAGLEDIPVIVREFTPEQKLEIALVENVQREDLTPMEEAGAYRHLMDALGLSQQEVADKVGKKRSTVANSLRLLKLPDAMREAVELGKLSAGHARALLSVTNPADQELLYDKIVEKSMSVREAESTAAEMNKGLKSGDETKAPNSPQTPKDSDLDGLEQEFIQTLGTRVSLKGSLSKGKLEISWFSREDLDRIYEILMRKN